MKPKRFVSTTVTSSPWFPSSSLLSSGLTDIYVCMREKCIQKHDAMFDNEWISMPISFLLPNKRHFKSKFSCMTQYTWHCIMYWCLNGSMHWFGTEPDLLMHIKHRIIINTVEQLKNWVNCAIKVNKAKATFTLLPDSKMPLSSDGREDN